MFCSASSIADSKDFFCLSATQIDPAQIRLFCWAVKSQRLRDCFSEDGIVLQRSRVLAHIIHDQREKLRHCVDRGDEPGGVKAQRRTASMPSLVLGSALVFFPRHSLQ